MNQQSPIPHMYLSNAVSAARRALLRIDTDEVPAALRKVAASSARRLPPPLLASLLDYLDDSEWLRDRAQEAWPEADVEDPDPRRAVSSLFLLRPDDWEDRSRRLLAAVDDGSELRDLVEAKREIERLRRIVRDLGDRLEKSQRQAESAREDVATELQDRVERSKALRRRALADRSEALAQLENARQEVERLTGELDEADQRIEELRMRRMRRQGSDRTEFERGFGRGDPLSVAQDLDRLMETLRVDGDHAQNGVSEVVLVLPSGVRPDEVAAIEWLLAQPVPLDVLVDGYNVAHDLASPPDVLTRRKVEEGLVRMRRLATAPLSIRLFWDTTAEEDRLPARGIDVRYVESADDAIVDEVHGSSRPVVVISTDGELRERAVRPGMLSLWGTALSGWLQRR